MKKCGNKTEKMPGKGLDTKINKKFKDFEKMDEKKDKKLLKETKKGKKK